MSNSNSTSNHFWCPEGGTWYACPEKPHFVGCCSVDPCTNVDEDSTSPCPKLSKAAFDPSIYDKFTPNTCIGSANASWYTCKFTNPPFLGCCLSDPCADPEQTGCSDDDLIPAAWSGSSRNQLALFQDEGTDDKSGEGEEDLSEGAIAGIAVGGIAALVIVGALVWFFIRRKKKKAATMSQHEYTPSAAEGNHQMMYPSPASPYQDSQFSSPGGTAIGAGHDPKHTSTSSTGITLPSLSPRLPSEEGRPISEIYSKNIGSEHISQQKYTHDQSYGLGLHGTQKPEPIHELEDNNMTEVHELDGLGGNRR